MTDITFVQGTIIEPTWLQDANDHVNDKAGIKHTASKISNIPSGNISATTVQAAIDELDQVISALSKKNLLINGAMRVSQRGASSSASGTAVFVCDRWLTSTNGGGTVTASKDFTSGNNFLKSEYSSGTVSSVVYRQRIESKEVNGLHIVGSVTASLKAYQDTGSSQTWAISLYKPTAGDDNYSSGETLISSQNITVGSGSWSSHSVTFSGLVEADVINGLAFRITTGALTSSKINGISEVQLEIGSVATEFERSLYGLELALCQRYCYIPQYCIGTSYSTTAASYANFFPVTMRSTPTASAGLGVASGTVFGAGSMTGIASFSVLALNTQYARFSHSYAALGSAGSGVEVIMNGSYLSAEL